MRKQVSHAVSGETTRRSGHMKRAKYTGEVTVRLVAHTHVRNAMRRPRYRSRVEFPGHLGSNSVLEYARMFERSDCNDYEPRPPSAIRPFLATGMTVDMRAAPPPCEPIELSKTAPDPAFHTPSRRHSRRAGRRSLSPPRDEPRGIRHLPWVSSTSKEPGPLWIRAVSVQGHKGI